MSETNPSEANDPPSPEDLKAIELLESAIQEEMTFRHLLEVELLSLKSTIRQLKIKKLKMSQLL